MFTKGSWGFLTTSSLISDFSLNTSNLISSTFVPWLCSAWIRCNLLSLITAVALHGITALWRWHLKYEDLWKSPNDKYLLEQDLPHMVSVMAFGLDMFYVTKPIFVLVQALVFTPIARWITYNRELHLFQMNWKHFHVKFPKWDLICYKCTEIKCLLARH